MKISVITPTYNRKSKVIRSIDSSFESFPDNSKVEVIVIDDCSTDGSFEYLHNKYKQNIKSRKLKLIRLPENIGVTGAKNEGIKHALGDWLIFMDSDDYFDISSINDLLEEINRLASYDILLFRCRTQDGSLMGEPKAASEIKIKELLNQGTPSECLLVIKRHVINKIPYKGFLRGGEALTYLEILDQGYKAYISDLVVRVYDDSGDDRLCTKNLLHKRAKQLLQFNLLKLRFIKHMTAKTFTKTTARILFYTFIYLKKKLT